MCPFEWLKTEGPERPVQVKCPSFISFEAYGSLGELSIMDSYGIPIDGNKRIIGDFG